MGRLTVVLVLVGISVPAIVAAAPEPPQNLAVAVAGNTVTLTWQAPGTGSAPLGYLIEASLSPGGATIAAFLVVDTTIVLNAVPDGVYYARVRSGNAEGISGASPEVVVSVPSGGGPCTTPPNAPTNLTANVSGSLVTLNWLAGVGECAATAYVVQAGSAAGLSDIALINVGNALTVSVEAPPGAYFVRVVAVNAFGAGGASNELPVLVGDLTALWFGTSDYPNAPFQFSLAQLGRSVSGNYQDQHDSGSAFGRLSGNRIQLDVNFGDTGIRYEGVIESASRISGLLYVPVLGGRTFTFQMTR